MMLDRRSVLVGAASSLLISPAVAQASLLHLDPKKIAEWQRKIKSQHFEGSKGKVDYADVSPPGSRPIILYFHGTSAPYEISMPLQYPFLDTYRIVMPNRPSYGSTALDWGTDATSIADMAYELLGHRGIREPVIVMGTSAGGPGALAFAAKYSPSTKAVVLNSAVTHTWTEAKYVPLAGGLRGRFRTLLEMKELYAIAARIIFLGGVPQFDFDKNIVGVGENLIEARKDIAFAPFKKLFTDKKHIRRTEEGVKNDYLELYLAEYEFVENWSAIKAPVLLTHCERDIVVPTEHSLFVREQLPRSSKLLTFDKVAGHITALGSDAGAAHKAVRDFLGSIT